MTGIRNTPPTPGTPYEIRVKGILDNSWPEWFGDLNIRTARDGSGDPITLIEGFFIDQAALRGVLEKLWNLNVILIGVKRLNPQTEDQANPMEE